MHPTMLIDARDWQPRRGGATTPAGRDDGVALLGIWDMSTRAATRHRSYIARRKPDERDSCVGKSIGTAAFSQRWASAEPPLEPQRRTLSGVVGARTAFGLGLGNGGDRGGCRNGSRVRESRCRR